MADLAIPPVSYVRRNVTQGLELVSTFTSKRKLKFKGHPLKHRLKLNGVRYLEGDSRRDTSYLLTLCRTTHAYRMVKYSILGSS